MTREPAQLPTRLRGQRERLPDTRDSVTRVLRLRVRGENGVPEEVACYATVGLYPDGTPGELFLVVDKEGSTVSGFADALAMAISIGLQYGVPLSAYTAKLRRTRFEPAGSTGDRSHPLASSLLDYLAAWLDARVGPRAVQTAAPETP